MNDWAHAIVPPPPKHATKGTEKQFHNHSKQNGENSAKSEEG